MNPRLAHIIVHGDQLTLQAPYDQDFLEDLKQMIPYQYRKWVPETKAWLVGCCRAELVSICRAHYDRVIIHDENVEAHTSNWAAAMFAELPSHLHHPVYRALARVLHPDKGGDLDSMQALAAAYAEMQTAA